MKLANGTKVRTNPDIKTQPSGWDLDGEMWSHHLARATMTIAHPYNLNLADPQYACTIDGTDEMWVYKQSELIPYKTMLEEVEEL